MILVFLAVVLLIGALYAFRVNPVYSGLRRLFGRSDNPPVEASVGIFDFSADSIDGVTNDPLSFRMVTDLSAVSVRIIDTDKNVIYSTSRIVSSDQTSIVWDLSAEFPSPFSGNVYASAGTASGNWTDSDKFVSVSVTEPTPSPAPTYTPLPTQAPAVVDSGYAVTAKITDSPTPTETPTEEPTVVPSTDAPTAEAAAVIPTEALATDVPTPEPTLAPTATPTLEPTPTPSSTPMPAAAAAGHAATDLKLTERVYSGAKVQNNYSREKPIIAQDADQYSYFVMGTGIYTFRGDNFRRNGAFGTADVTEGRLEPMWEFSLGSLRTESGTLYGVGWNNQPAIIKWTKQVRNMMNLNPASKEETAMREVIFSGQDGKIYFINLKTGEASRDPINIGFPMRGSVSVDTLGRPMISFGQAISRLPSKTGPIGYYIYNLLDSSQLLFINGRSSDNQKQYSTNGAFDSCSLFIYSQGRDAMIVAGENGLLYTVELKTDFNYPKETDTEPVTPSLSINAEIIYQSSLAKNEKEARTTVESAVAMYNTYVYVADGYGIIRCVDTDSMRTVWAFDAGDNTDAAMALDLDGKDLSLYTGNTAFQRMAKGAPVTIRRINALTGEEVWKYEISCVKDNTSETSGCKASPVIGQNDLSGLVFFTVNKVTEGGSRLVALNKDNGQVVWEFSMGESISSPVAVYNKAGNGWIIACDGDGKVYILDGLTGYLNSDMQVDGAIEASPAVYNNMLVIGTCSKNPKMYCFTIK
ncbi:MAG: PQQ-binding-like beta-propeller repeat protein [Clostridia bacterium]|nr:PQQ-binding-like beta-propeller repeat protein [Clostridia bacterium]